MKYIVAIDIGGTTFNSGIFSQSMNQVASSDKDKIRNYRIFFLHLYNDNETHSTEWFPHYSF